MNDHEKFLFLQRFVAWLKHHQLTQVEDADIYAFLEYNR